MVSVYLLERWSSALPTCLLQDFGTDVHGQRGSHPRGDTCVDDTRNLLAITCGITFY